MTDLERGERGSKGEKGVIGVRAEPEEDLIGVFSSSGTTDAIAYPYVPLVNKHDE